MLKLFYDDFYQMSRNFQNLNVPELHHTESGSYFNVEVPGFNKDNLTVEVKNNQLLINGERQITFGSDSLTTKSTISKKYTISEKYDQEKIKADLKDGILEIFFPFKKENEKKVINLLK